MTTTPGFPLITIPAYSVPAFTAGSVAVGATITTVKLESSSGSAQTNVPFRFGQVFKSGEISASSFMVGKITGQADVPLQFNALATWPDGSVRHAVISGVLPTLAAGTTVDMALVRASSGTSTTAIAPGSLSSLSAKAVLDFGGTAYTADAGPAIAALVAGNARIAGSIATEYNVTLAPVTSGGTAHPNLEVKFDVVYFPAASAFKVDITFEHTKAFTATGDLSYSGTIQIGGTTIYTLPNPLTHFPRARWKRTYWQNNTSPLVVRQDRDYWIDSKAVVNYDRRVNVTEATLTAYVTQASDPAFAPMGNGIFTKAMAAVGGRPDIGLMPGYAAATVLSMDKRAIALTKACGEIAGSWGVHVRDPSTGPGKGLVMSCVNWPYATGTASAADVNPSTGQNELIPAVTTSSQLEPDDSHTPNFAYLPYLLTGDLFYLEEMQFWANGIFNNYAYRQKEKGIIQKTQVRGQAWSLRGLVECAAFTPDNHPLKSHFQYWVNSNIANYDALYTNNPNATPLGCLSDQTNFSDLAYSVNGSANGIGLYQDDFFTSVIGHAVELGFTSAQPLLQWKAKFQIGRMIAPGVCYITSCTISLRIKENNAGPTYSTLAECYANHVGAYAGSDMNYYTQAIHDAPCGSQQQLDLLNASRLQPSQPFVLGQIVGYSTTTEGYPSNLQPGLALAVDSGYTDGDLAWDLFDNRAGKPDYGTSPQFAVVPRGVIASTPTTPTTPTDPTPDPQPIVRKVMSFDRVNTTTTSTGTGTMTVSSTATRRYLPLSSIPIGTLVALVIEDENGDDWEESYCTVLSATTFSRDTVIKGSNGASKVNFGAGTKTVFATLTADQINAFLTASSLTGAPAVTTVADPTAVSLLTNIGGVVKQITAANFLASVGVTAAQLPAVTAANIAGANILEINQPTGDGGATVDAMYTYLVNRMTAAGLFSGSTSTPAPGQVTGLAAGTATNITQDLSWTAVSGATSYKVEKSAAGANTWTVANDSVTGTSYTVTGLTASTSYDYRVTASNATGPGTPSSTVTKSTTAAPAGATITVANPSSPQTVGVAYTVSGTWTGTQPTALDYLLTDNGTAGAWNNATASLVINANGTYSFSITPTTASTSRTITVRDHNATSVVSAPSAAYVVNAAAASTYAYSRFLGDHNIASLTIATGITRSTTNAGTYDGPGGPANTTGKFIAYAGNLGITTGSDVDYVGVTPSPASPPLMGWGPSPTVPPSGTDFKDTNGYLAASSAIGNITGGTGTYYSVQAYMGVKDPGVGSNTTVNEYLWIKAGSDAPVCVNPSNPCQVTLS